jgi:histidine triad (HIT) family protein
VHTGRQDRVGLEACVFCEIVRGAHPASIVCQDELTMAFIDLRQFHPGHTLVIPRRHLRDVRELDDATGAALMASLARIARAVSAAFPNQGLSVWHSVGVAADQEVSHLHVHVHPRLLGDRLLKVYPSTATEPDKLVRDGYAEILRSHLTATS